MNPFSFFCRRPAKIVADRTRPSLELLEGRDLPSTLIGAPLIGPVPLIDPMMAIANAERAQDARLTRTDVIDLFETAAGTEQAIFTDGKVSFKAISKPDLSKPLPAVWVADLQAIGQNGAQWGMTPDVADLAKNVVAYEVGPTSTTTVRPC